MDFAVDVRPDQAWSSIVQSISAAKGAESSILPAQNGLTGISHITRSVACFTDAGSYTVSSEIGCGGDGISTLLCSARARDPMVISARRRLSTANRLGCNKHDPAHYRLTREMNDVLSDREPLIEPTTGTRVG